MPNEYRILYTLVVIAGSATFLRASLQPNATVLCSACDWSAGLVLVAQALNAISA